LHVLNGDATVAPFVAAGVPGERLVWHDILVEGPVTAGDPTPEGLAVRAAWLAARLGIEAAQYARAVAEQAAALETARQHDEVVLWFEQDLFCAVNLWAILDRLTRHAPAVRLGLVYPGTDDVRGLGATSPDRLAAFFADRSRVTDAMRTQARQAWAAYTASDPLAIALLVEGQGPLPFVGGASRCHLGRFPSVGTGLNEIETAALEVLCRGSRPFGDLFRKVGADPRVRGHGMGDVQFAACVRGLGPLGDVAGDDVATAEIHITRRGWDVAAGNVDRLSVMTLDTWLGGVRLRPGAAPWRWDGARGHLIVPAD
jgi:hypothetical protein